MNDQYFTEIDMDNHERYFKIPYRLIEDDYFSGLDPLAVMIYGILIDRVSLSQKNKQHFTDKDGHLYVIATNAEICNWIKKSEPVVIKLKRELIEHGLLKERRQGVRLANLLYPQKLRTKETLVQELKNVKGITKETLVQELSKGSIHKVAGYQANTDCTYILLEVENELANQLDEPQPVKVPQFVADWITHSKNIGRSLFGAMSIFEENFEIKKWMQWAENQETFARAWIFGYEVEKEKQYLVKMPKANFNGNIQILSFKNNSFFWSSNWEGYKAHHTRKELEDAGFGSVFDCEGIEVEEVEE
ncbi:TPA: DUF1642 domain-containing protein [Streptococcus pneumoniae]